MRIIAKVQDHGIYKRPLTAAAEMVMKRKTIIAKNFEIRFLGEKKMARPGAALDCEGLIF